MGEKLFLSLLELKVVLGVSGIESQTGIPIIIDVEKRVFEFFHVGNEDVGSGGSSVLILLSGEDVVSDDGGLG